MSSMFISTPVTTQETFDYQKKLFPYAYNILGTVEDAKDAVQDVLVRHLSARPTGVNNEKNYLIRSVINHAINLKNRTRKTVDEKVWLPEPVAPETSDGSLYRNEILSYSVLVLLEKLNAKERAVFILREAFDYSHDEISEILLITEENSRQLLTRAKKKLNGSKKIVTPSPADMAIAEKYYAVIKNADVHELEKMLIEEVTIIADGGSKVNVVQQFLQGKKSVADLLLLVFIKYQSALKPFFTQVNHQPALLYYNNSNFLICQVLEIDEAGKLSAIYSILDPDKLKNLFLDVTFKS